MKDQRVGEGTGMNMSERDVRDCWDTLAVGPHDGWEPDSDIEDDDAGALARRPQ